MAQLADDIAAILDHLSIPSVHAVIGVSQGGATALAFGLRHPTRTDRIVACDTQAKRPAANSAAWDVRIASARKEGMAPLAEVTASRWFPASPEWIKGGKHGDIIQAMINGTTVEGFAAGAAALQGYDLLEVGLVDALAVKGKKVLLVAGELDGSIPKTLAELAAEVKQAGGDVNLEIIPGAGHLPMFDAADAWLAAVSGWLKA